MEDVLIAIMRKVLFMVLLYGGYALFDKLELRGFVTREVLKGDAKAVALILGLLSIAIALA